jgi:catechol 2,3-dioxygenase-like lactoylglutathione lyase family enzyme
MTENIINIHHSSLLVADTQASLKFYCGILNLNQLERPNLPFPGAWLEIGAQQLHYWNSKTRIQRRVDQNMGVETDMLHLMF